MYHMRLMNEALKYHSSALFSESTEISKSLASARKEQEKVTLSSF